MELILKTNNENSIAKIIALAKKLNVTVEQRTIVENKKEREEIIKRILNYKSTEPSSFGDAVEWQRDERNDRGLPFSA